MRIGGPFVLLLFLALLFLSIAVNDKVDVQIDGAGRAVERELATLTDNIRGQSSAFASTSFIGYSVGRYYGFASAFQQISPDPERAAALLRATYPPGDAAPVDVPAAMTAYAAVHDRFHASFKDMLASTVFDDLYLIDRFGRVVYSLRKDAAFGADLASPRQRDGALGSLFREVMARIQQAPNPEQVMVLTPPLPLEPAHGMLLGRPVVRHGTVEGVVVFRMPIAKVRERLAQLATPGIGFALLDGAGNMVATAPAPEILHGWTQGDVRVQPDSGWHYQVLWDTATLAGGLLYMKWGLWLVSLLLLALAVRPLRRPRPDPAGLPIGPSAPLDVAPPLVVRDAVAEPRPAVAVPTVTPVAMETPAEEPEAVEPADEADQGQGAALDADENYRRCIVDVMTLALDYWQKAKRKGKIELAEESGLWRVYMDRSSLQTRTLDKYLLVETLPRNPRWRDVVRTAEYVLRHCGEPPAERDELTTALTRLKQHLRQAERV